MKIYTKTGDRGETGLIGGYRIIKSDPRIKAYGAVDELNSTIGISISFLQARGGLEFTDLIKVLTKVQNELFILGSDLADPSFPDKSKYNTPRVDEKMSLELESQIDKFESELEQITNFILPGGSIESSFLHLARSVARRAETEIVSLSNTRKINPATIVYMNRLSDLLFVTARVANKRQRIKDITWIRETNSSNKV